MVPLTKISAPRSSGIIPRERGFRLLDECLRRTAVWVASPAGSGKTTLVASFLEARKIPCLWYKADSGDGDIATFFYYMGLAAKKAAPRFRKSLPLLTPEYLMGIPAFARKYFEALFKRFKPPFAIVLDNFQEIPAGSGFHKILNIALSLVPEGINMIVLSRNAAPEAYARLLANNRISRLGWEDVRLTEEESREIVRAKDQRELPDEILALFHKKTEGWVAGLMLLIESAKSKLLNLQLLNKFTPDEIFGYFAAEIFRKTDRQEQEFLLATAHLPSMTVSMAEALTGIKAAGKILRSLNERNFFTERHVIKDHPVFLYHPLFKEFLISRAHEMLAPEERTAIQRKAAGLLINAGQVEDAAALLLEAEDWSGLVALILEQAPVLMSRGRSRTIAEWIGRIPQEIVENIPWLLYWKGICSMPLNPAESRKLLEGAHRLFKDQGDDAGALLTWAGAVDACFFAFDDFRPLDELIDWLDERVRRCPSYPSPAIEAGVAVAMGSALLWRRPDHPDISNWMRRASSLAQNSPNTMLHVNAPISASIYYNWMGETAAHCIVLDQMKKMAESGSTPPLVKIASKFMESHFHMQQPGEYSMALHAASEGLALAAEMGVHLLDPLFFSQMAFGALIMGNRGLTEEYLKKMEAYMGPGRRGDYAIYYTILSFHNLNLGKIPDAASYAQKAVAITSETGKPFPEAMSRVLAAQADFEAGDRKEAARQLAHAEKIFSRIGTKCFEYTCHLIEAYFAFSLGRESEGLDVLRKGLTLAKKKSYTHAPYFWRQDVMVSLCIKALEAGIEVDYVQRLIRKLNLVPDVPPLEVEKWPWPVKIFTLGRFEVMRDSRPLEFPAKAPRKIIALLKLLVSCGANGASAEHLADVLWTDADGDAALQSLATSIHRLRQLLGSDKAIQRRDGLVTLDAGYCWVDAHAFEELLDRAVSSLKPPLSSEDAQARLIEKALLFYKDAFLSESVEHWALSYRERLREKFLKAARRLGRQYEDGGRFERAIECYQKGLEIDHLTEEFYCRIMKCCCAAGRKAEAIAVYMKCKRILQTVLNVDPSPETEALYRTLSK
ncbi:MAG: AAA family ATPase [Desulfobacteraceae bacterium]|nr:MAG: AAA family ATPase [Desulfobacteraceae bacterium]